MNHLKKSALIFRLFLLSFAFVSGYHPTQALAETVVLVDKAKYQIHIADYENGFEILKTYPVTIGKNSGDKVVEGDLKTPEGIYLFTQKYLPPAIKRKFGAMAFYINYPNIIDKAQGKTGFDIMLHSTDDPARLEKPQDSDGCIVVNDERIKEIDPYIKPQKTMILVYDDLKPEYLLPAATDELKSTFEKWIQAWSAKDLETYIDLYSADFKFKNMKRSQYKDYKALLNQKYHTIAVTPSNMRFYAHPKYNLVIFQQEYISKFKDGRVAFRTNSTKRLYFTRENNSLKIAYEGN